MVKPKKIEITPFHLPDEEIEGKKTQVLLYNNILEYKIKFEHSIINEELTGTDQKIKVHVNEDGIVDKNAILSICRYIDNYITEDGTNYPKPTVEVIYGGHTIHLSCNTREEQEHLYSKLKEWRFPDISE